MVTFVSALRLKSQNSSIESQKQQLIVSSFISVALTNRLDTYPKCSFKTLLSLRLLNNNNIFRGQYC